MVLGLTLTPPLSESGQKELARLQGEWIAQRLASQGGDVDFTTIDRQLVARFDGPLYTFTGRPKGYITLLDPGTDPKLMNIRSIERGRQLRTDEAIFKIDGDTLSICLYQGDGRQRPTGFEKPTEPGVVLAVFKRAKR
jgi:uncharacterized protein (TIGR03067 family)